MKTRTFVSSLALLALAGSLVTGAPLGTAFTYHGQLTEGGNPAKGSYDLKFTLHDNAGSGSAVAGPITNSPVLVSNGLFTTTLDFGDVFDGNARWLEIGVRSNGVAVEFTALAPLQAITATPYALYTPSAGAAGTAIIASTVAVGAVGPAGLQTGAVDSSKIADGGGTSPGGVFTVSGTIGQPDAGTLSGGNFTLQGGFWSIIAVPTPGAPTLSIFRTPTNTVCVWWTVSDISWQLQATTNLVNTSTVWTAYAYMTNGPNCIYIESPPTGKKFCRLKK